MPRRHKDRRQPFYGSDDLGSYLRGLRASAGLTQEEMADRLGLSAPTISQYESRRRAPSLNVLLSLRDIVGLTDAEFIDLCRMVAGVA